MSDHQLSMAAIRALQGQVESLQAQLAAAVRESERLRAAAGRYLRCTKTSECQFDDDVSGETCGMVECKAEADLEGFALAAEGAGDGGARWVKSG